MTSFQVPPFLLPPSISPHPLDISLTQWQATIQPPTLPPQKINTTPLPIMTSLLKSADSHMTSLKSLYLQLLSVPVDQSKELWLKVHEHKQCLDHIVATLTPDKCQVLKHKIKKNRRRRAQRKRDKSEEIERIREKEEKCHKWLDKRRKEELRVRLAKSVEISAAESLTAVRKKKQDIEYYSKLLEAIKDLRQFRHDHRSKGELPPIEEDEQFVTTCSSLENILTKYTEVYKKEEHALKVMMSEKVDKEMMSRESHTHSPMSLEDYYTQANTNPTILAHVRQQWNMFLSPSGTVISQRWVEPVLPSNQTWASYLKLNDYNTNN